jgi:hypothetical protein
MPTPSEALIAQLALTLEPADREPFRKDAEAAIAALPMQGDGVTHRTVTAVWGRYFHPPATGEPRNRSRPSILQRASDGEL